MIQAQSLQKVLQGGGTLDAAKVTQENVADAAQKAGLAFFVVECDKARSRSAVLRAVVKSVDFPEFFGGDLDAFYDCLCDTVLDQKTGLVLWFNRLHSGDPALQEDAEAILDVAANAVEYASNNGRVFVYAVDHAGKHPDPEPGVAPTPYSGSSDTDAA